MSVGRGRHQIPPEVVAEFEAFRALMRKRRRDLGLTHNQVSEAMGRSPDFVALLENRSAETMPNLVTVMLWVEALGGQLTPNWTD